MTTQTTTANPATTAHTITAESVANQLVERYIAAWNETDAVRRGSLIAQTFADDISYIDPLMAGQGHAGISALVQGVQTQFAGHQFRQIGKVDAHHQFVRFSWELAPADGLALVGGTDVAELGSDGRMQTVTGFLDRVPGTM